MKINRFHEDGEPKDDLHSYSRAEQKLLMLMGGVSSKYKADYFGMEKSQSIRFTSSSYPKVKALAELSGNSVNTIVNDMIEVAFGAIMENLSEEDSDKLFNKECLIREEWLKAYQPKEQE